MSVRILLISVLACLSLPATLASARITARDSVSATVHRQGGIGKTITYKGTATSRLFGNGTVVEKAKISGLGATGTVTITYAQGTVRATTTAKIKPKLSLNVGFTGSYRITGGTGRYKTIAGTGSFSGKGPINLSKASFTQVGFVSY